MKNGVKLEPRSYKIQITHNFEFIMHDLLLNVCIALTHTHTHNQGVTEPVHNKKITSGQYTNSLKENDVNNRRIKYEFVISIEQ